MASASNFLQNLFGSKTERDTKQIKPILDKTLEEYKRIDKLSDDELREETFKIKTIVLNRVADKEKRIAEIKSELESIDIPLKKQAALVTESDKLKEEVENDLDMVLFDILPQAFAIVKSTARRFKENSTIKVKASDMDREFSTIHDYVTIEGDFAIWKNTWLAGGNRIVWDMVHYDVQIQGGVALFGPNPYEESKKREDNRMKGKIAEMATGEGKTLVATLPVFLYALSGKGVHVVTVNDYLSKRDSEWMGPLYEFHGLTVDCLDKHQPNSEGRKKAYRSDITFGTNNEFGFDYLRDNMAIDLNDLVQRDRLFYAIVDEVDSVLIDDARTPLIISGPVPKGDDQQFMEYKPYVERLYTTQRLMVNKLLNETKKCIADGDTEIVELRSKPKEDEYGNFVEEGKVVLTMLKSSYNLLVANKGLPKYKPLVKFLSEQGMKIKLQNADAEIIKASFTDKGIEQREVTKDLLFVIDEKMNSVELTDKGNDLISQTLDDSQFFVLQDIGTAVAEIKKSDLSIEEKQAKEDALLADYALKSERVHTVNQLLKAYSMFEKDVEYVIIDNKIKIVDEQTGRIMEGRRYSEGLHQAIEAKENVKVEAATQTFATITLQNYFRMYHRLAGMTGTAETEAGEFWEIYKLDVVVVPTNKPIIRKDEADLIYKTKKEKYDAVIEKIVELTKQGRPVLVGTTSVEISEVLSRLLNGRNIKNNVLNAKQHAREAEIVANAGQPSVVTIATNMAGRGTDIKLGKGVRESGGLAIIGTERHDSRRVDRQLRGRAGRQGDPGSSTFYVSLEDDLMRLFGSDRIASIVDKMGLEKGEVLQHPMLSSSIERAQKKVEENHFGVRKRLIKYDDVMNGQRKVIYKRRRNALNGESMDIEVGDMISDYCNIIAEKMSGASYEEFSEEIIGTLSITLDFDEEYFRRASTEQVADALIHRVQEEYLRRSDVMVQQAWPVIKSVYEMHGNRYQNIAIPIGDGKKLMQIPVNLKKAYENKGKEIMRSVSKTVTLISIDDVWRDHLRDMDDLKVSAQNATYEQKDPELIYKIESFNLFTGVIEKINKNVLSFLLRSHIPVRASEDPTSVRESTRRKADMSNMQTSRTDLVTNGGEPKSNSPVRVEKKVGRNDPCPCGSGKKYKNCHGKE